MIKLLNRRPQVAGYLKIGVTVDGRRKDNSAYTRPSKLDHIEVTGTERDGADSLVPDVDLMLTLIERMIAAGVDPMLCGGCDRAKALGFPLGLPRRLPIYLPNGDLERVFPNRLALYKSRTALCHGDGEEAQRLQPVRGGKPGELSYQPFGPCGEACPDFANGTCKPNGKLYLCISGAPRVGAVFAFHTTSWNSITNIIGGLEAIIDIAGTVELLPLFFDLQSRTVTPTRGAVGNPSTAWIASVYFPGTERDLLKIAGEELTAIGSGRARVREIAAQIAAGAWQESPEEVAQIEREFYAPGEAMRDEVLAPSSASLPVSPGAPDDAAACEGDVIDVEPVVAASSAAAASPVAGPQPATTASSEAGVPSRGSASWRHEIAGKSAAEIDKMADALDGIPDPTAKKRARLMRLEAAKQRGVEPVFQAAQKSAQAKPVESEGAAEEEATNEDVADSTVGCPVAAPSGTSEPNPVDEPNPFDETPAEVAALKIDDDARRELVGLMRAAGLTEPRECLQRMSVLCGREVASTKDLTLGEYKDVADHLRNAAARIAATRPQPQESML